MGPVPERGRFEIQTISSLIGAQPRIWRRIEGRAISFVIGARTPKGGMSKLKPYPPWLGPAPDKAAYRNSSHIVIVWALAPERERIETQTISSLIGVPAPDKATYQSSNHILFDWGPAPDKAAYRSSNHILLDWAQRPIRRRVEAQTISSPDWIDGRHDFSLALSLSLSLSLFLPLSLSLSRSLSLSLSLFVSALSLSLAIAL